MNVVNAHHFKLAALIKNNALCALFSVFPPQICILHVLQQDAKCALESTGPSSPARKALRPKQGDYITVHHDSVFCSLSLAALNTAWLTPPPSSQSVHGQISIIKFQISSQGAPFCWESRGDSGVQLAQAQRLFSWDRGERAFVGSESRSLLFPRFALAAN